MEFLQKVYRLHYTVSIKTIIIRLKPGRKWAHLRLLLNKYNASAAGGGAIKS
jgi:hypothetical protein